MENNTLLEHLIIIVFPKRHNCPFLPNSALSPASRVAPPPPCHLQWKPLHRQKSLNATPPPTRHHAALFLSPLHPRCSLPRHPLLLLRRPLPPTPVVGVCAVSVVHGEPPLLDNHATLDDAATAVALVREQ